MSPHSPEPSNDAISAGAVGTRSRARNTGVAATRQRGAAGASENEIVGAGNLTTRIDGAQAEVSECHVAETIGALVHRLGTPPPDLIDQLVERFRAAAEQAVADGSRIGNIDLDQWVINELGQIVFEVPSDHDLEQDGPEQAATDIESVVSQFEGQLHSPRPTPANSPTAECSQRRFDPRDVAETDISQLSRHEQTRREQIINQFTASLEQRFGVDVIRESNPDGPQKSRQPKLQPLTRHRKFNWNLVLGVGTAAAVIGMVWTGMTVSEMRQQRARLTANATEFDSRTSEAASPVVLTPELDVSELTAAEISASEAVASERVESHPEGSTNDRNNDLTVRNPMVDVDFQPSTVRLEREGAPRSVSDLIIGYSQDLPDDRVSPAAKISAPSVADADSFEGETKVGQSDIEAILHPGRVLNREEAESRASQQSAAGEKRQTDEQPQLPEFPIENADSSRTLNDVWRDTADETGPESEQPVRVAKTRFVELPTTSKTNSVAVVDAAGVELRAIEFPQDVPISMSAPDLRDTVNLVNDRTGVVLASLRRDASGARVFQWVQGAANDSLSNRFVHGRLVDANGGLIYLRPAIEADGMPLALNIRNPSWSLGAPILRAASELQLELSVPDSIDLAWQTPFNVTRPRKGEAIAILTPTDGETVAVAIKLKVETDRRLSCKLEYACRLDPKWRWMPLTEAGLSDFQQRFQQYEDQFGMYKRGIEQQYDLASSNERSFLREQKAKMEVAEQELKLMRQRLAMLTSLISQMETQVGLELHLYVQWPESQQTILRTAP